MKIIKKIILEDIQKDMDDNISKLIEKLNGYLSEERLKKDWDIFKNAIKYLKSTDILNAREEIKKLEGYPQSWFDIQDIYSDWDIISNPIYDKNWGLKPGKYLVWRAGTIDMKLDRGIFTAIDEVGAKLYLDSDNPNRTLHSYWATIKHPYISTRLESAYSDLANIPLAKVLKTKASVYDQQKWWRDLDKKIFNLAKKKGYDSITYTRPAPPASKEMVLFNKNQLELIQ